MTLPSPGYPTGKRAAIVGVALFVVLFIFNLLWPYGETPVFMAG